jgi:hypothetical protein
MTVARLTAGSDGDGKGLEGGTNVATPVTT